MSLGTPLVACALVEALKQRRNLACKFFSSFFKQKNQRRLHRTAATLTQGCVNSSTCWVSRFTAALRPVGYPPWHSALSTSHSSTEPQPAADQPPWSLDYYCYHHRRRHRSPLRVAPPPRGRRLCCRSAQARRRGEPRVRAATRLMPWRLAVEAWV